MECALTEASIRVSDGCSISLSCFFFFQAEDGIRDLTVTGVQTCALPIYTLQQLIVSTRRCRRIALLHPWCPASVSPALAARFPKSSARTRDEATTRKEFLVATMSLRHSGCGLDLRTFPDAGGDEHEAQAADRAKCTRQLPNGRGETGIGVPPDEDADGALCQQCLHFMRGVHREDALTGIEHERAQDPGLRKAERGQTDAAASGAPQPFTP